jgi:hypothetical protein
MRDDSKCDVGTCCAYRAHKWVSITSWTRDALKESLDSTFKSSVFTKRAQINKSALTMSMPSKLDRSAAKKSGYRVVLTLHALPNASPEADGEDAMLADTSHPLALEATENKELKQQELIALLLQMPRFRVWMSGGTF